MNMTDPIADMLTRIRNAVTAKHEFVNIPASKMKLAIADVLRGEGFIRDYEVTEEANRLYNEGYAVIAIPELAQPVKFFPDNIQQKMIKNDFDWAASNREPILTEWQKRYDSKSEPKS